MLTSALPNLGDEKVLHVADGGVQDAALDIPNLTTSPTQTRAEVVPKLLYPPTPASNYPRLDSKDYQIRTIRFELRVVGRSKSRRV